MPQSLAESNKTTQD